MNCIKLKLLYSYWYFAEVYKKVKFGPRLFLLLLNNYRKLSIITSENLEIFHDLLNIDLKILIYKLV